MPIAERQASVLRLAKHCPKPQLRAFVAHFLTVRGIGPRKLDDRWAPALVRRGWMEPNGKITADGTIVGSAFMNEDLG